MPFSNWVSSTFKIFTNRLILIGTFPSVKDVETQLDTPEMQDKLGAAIKEVIEGIEEIVNTARQLTNEIENVQAKQGLLNGSKKLLQNMVNCLQILDINQCSQLIILSNQTKTDLEMLRSCTVERRSRNEFKSVCQTLIDNFIALSVAAHDRRSDIPQPKFKQTVSSTFNSRFYCGQVIILLI